MSNTIIVDFEGFKLVNKDFIIKEFAYVNTKTGESMCYFFDSPSDYKYSEAELKVLVWLTKHFHKIDLDFGQTRFQHLKTIFNTLSATSDTIFLAKGIEKCKFLIQITGRKVHNLEDYGCPKFEYLLGWKESNWKISLFHINLFILNKN